jgi:hypothetical protein
MDARTNNAAPSLIDPPIRKTLMSDQAITWAIIIMGSLATWSCASVLSGLPDPGAQIINLFH